MIRLREGRLATVLTFPLARIVLGLLAFLVLLVPAQAVAGGVRAASLAGVLLETYGCRGRAGRGARPTAQP